MNRARDLTVTPMNSAASSPSVPGSGTKPAVRPIRAEKIIAHRVPLFVSRIASIKPTMRVGQVAQIIAGKPDASIMCCDSPNLGLVLPTLSLGGHGTANMTGNIAPREIATISTPWKGYKEAVDFKETYLNILPLWHYVYSHINPVALKSLMKAVGLPAGDLRRPLKSLEGAPLMKGVRIIRDLGLDKRYGYKIGSELLKAA